jgi:hypothetical protein
VDFNFGAAVRLPLIYVIWNTAAPADGPNPHVAKHDGPSFGIVVYVVTDEDH